MTARFAAASTLTLKTAYGKSIKTNTGKRKLTCCILGLANVTTSKINLKTPNSTTSSMNLDAPNEHSIRNFTTVLLVKILKITPKSKKNLERKLKKKIRS